jgi:fructokinase
MDHATMIGLGEILWDVFPDGPRFGGAPANFACSAAGLAPRGSDICMAGAVGQDELGRRALHALQAHGVDTSCVAQLDHATGQVLVQLDAQRHATYDFAADAAWDNFAWSPALGELADRADVVCFGTLGQRSDLSRKTIQQFVRATPAHCLRILDINLRTPYWDDRVVLESLQLANVLKLNDSELAIVARLFSFKGNDLEILQQLLSQFSPTCAALTRGADGALLVDESGEVSELPGKSTRVVDTVGAGDAFTAALAVGLSKGRSLAIINAWAIRVAAFVCSQPGATPELPDELRGGDG